MAENMRQPTIEDIVNWSANQNAPDYENNLQTKLPGYNVIFNFPTSPSKDPKEKYISFAAYVKNVSDKYSPKFSPEEVYGRMDPIPIYQRTKRSIQFDLDLPSNGIEQSIEIANKLNILVRNMYPSYQRNGSVNIISSPPLVRIFFSNLIYDTKTGGSLLGYFNGAINIIHDLEKGVFSKNQGYETYPRSYSLSFNFNVLHEYTPGYAPDSLNIINNPINILGRY